MLIVGIALMLLWMDWQLGLATLAVVPLLIGARIVWLPFGRETFRRVRETQSNVNSALAENINGIRTVQESRREEVNFSVYEEKAREALAAQVRSSQISQVMVVFFLI